jgi:uncharacterized protein YheU (UPF0270 family)
MTIPCELLNPEILDALIEDFVTRNGAVHGHTDIALQEMMQAVRDQLQNGTAEILYDEQSQNCTIVLAKTSGRE